MSNDLTGIGRATFGGLASGLDTNALLNGLLEIERIPLARIQSRRSEVANQRSLMQSLNSKLVELREAAKELDNRNDAGNANALTEEFLRYEGSSSNDSVVRVRAGTGASPGDIDVLVNELATSARRFSESFASDDAIALAEGDTITITQDNGDPDASPPIDATEIVITGGAGGTTLQDLRDQINTAEGNGGNVRADVLRVSESEVRLVLTSVETGLSNDLTITGDLVIEPVQSEATPDGLGANATNASIEVFGQTLTRESNLIDDVLTGITLELIGEAELDDADVPQSETVTVGIDADEIAAGLDRFVAAYNDVVDFIDNQFRYDENRNASGPLAGDTTLRSIQSQLRQIVSRGYQFAANPNNPFAPGGAEARGGSITGIGLELEGGGRLRLDREKLDEALARDALSVVQFFRGDVTSVPTNPEELAADPDAEPDLFEEGFASLVVQELEILVQSGDGTLAERDDAYQRRLDDFDASIERFEFRLAQREESLVLKFSELERVIAGLQNQQGFLSSLG